MLRKITTNIGQIRHEKLDGNEYLIVPVIAANDDMNGRHYPAAEWIRSVPGWNGRPVTLGHPEQNGSYTSANLPELTTQIIGQLFNVTFDEKLKGEMWIDLAKARRIGGDAMTAVRRFEQNEMVEVSTGLFGDVDENNNIINILPDHLAVLLHESGACSIRDGCGAPRFNTENDDMSELNDDTQTITPDGTVNLNVTTDTEGLFNRLTCWFNEHFLTADEPESEPVADEKVVTNAESDQDEPDDNQENQPMVNEQIEAVSSLINEFGGVDAMRSMLQSAQRVHVNAEQQRENVIASLVANSSCEFSEDELNGMGDDALAKIERLVKPVNYAGAGGGQFETNSDEWEYADTPVLAAKEGGE